MSGILFPDLPFPLPLTAEDLRVWSLVNARSADPMFKLWPRALLQDRRDSELMLYLTIEADRLLRRHCQAWGLIYGCFRSVELGL